ncbi:MAG: hypothetical protein IPL53_06775 [Ignavibacteria bacterium]|nr:hypothetical protein [Ignavibacteria bacterium]
MVWASIEISTHCKFSISSYIRTLSLACIITVFSGSGITKYQADLSKEKATVIIKALHDYEHSNNKFPEDLSELIPEFLESIPNSSMGWFDEPFKYFKRNDGSFDLTFPSYGGEYYITSAYSNGKWIETD